MRGLFVAAVAATALNAAVGTYTSYRRHMEADPGVQWTDVAFGTAASMTADMLYMGPFLSCTVVANALR